MHRLNICIDIDGTLTEPYYWIDKANEYFQMNITEEKVTEYEIHKVLNIPKEHYQAFYELYGEEIHRKAALREHVQEVILKLNLTHNLYYVTAREKRMEKVTKEWLTMHKLPYDGLFVLGSHYKVDKARELNCDLFLEDNYDNAIQLTTAGFRVLLLDTNYNRLPLPKGATRVYSWKAVYKFIENLAFEKIA